MLQVSILDALTALNLTALTRGGAPPTSHLSTSHTFVASRIVPFATHLQIQVLECAPSKPTKQIRFIVNDAVVPLKGSFEGCSADPNGLCAYDTVLAGLIKRNEEIDFDYACHGNCASFSALSHRRPFFPPCAASFSSSSSSSNFLLTLTSVSLYRLGARVRLDQGRPAAEARLKQADS